MTVEVLKQKGYIASFNIPEEKMQKLIKRINEEYNVVSYHNFSHAFSVFQLTMHCIFKE
jgi:ribosomal protein S8